MRKIWKRVKSLFTLKRVTVVSYYDFGSRHYRQTGRSTRLADMYIQLLFATGKITVIDHHCSFEANKYLRDIILKRLHSEHPYVFSCLYVRANEIIYFEKGKEK